MAHKYLDYGGVGYFWQKIKNNFASKNQALSNDIIVSTVSTSGTITGTVISPQITITKNTVTGALGYVPATTATFTTSLRGLVPASGENTDKYLKGDGSWGTPQGTTYTAATTVLSVSTSAVTGTSINYAREDHVHNIPSSVITASLGYEPSATDTIFGYCDTQGNEQTKIVEHTDYNLLDNSYIIITLVNDNTFIPRDGITWNDSIDFSSGNEPNWQIISGNNFKLLSDSSSNYNYIAFNFNRASRTISYRDSSNNDTVVYQNNEWVNNIYKTIEFEGEYAYKKQDGTSNTLLQEFTNLNSNQYTSSLELKVNDKDKKPIHINDKLSSYCNYTLTKGTYLVYYDGNNYYFRTDGNIPNPLFDYGSSNTSTKTYPSIGALPYPPYQGEERFIINVGNEKYKWTRKNYKSYIYLYYSNGTDPITHKPLIPLTDGREGFIYVDNSAAAIAAGPCRYEHIFQNGDFVQLPRYDDEDGPSTYYAYYERLLSMSVDELYANYAYVKELVTENLSTNLLYANKAFIGELSAEEILAKKITADYISAKSAYIEKLEAIDIEAQKLTAAVAFIGEASIDYASINTLQAVNGYIENLQVNKIDAKTVKAERSWIGGFGITENELKSIEPAENMDVSNQSIKWKNVIEFNADVLNAEEIVETPLHQDGFYVVEDGISSTTYKTFYTTDDSAGTKKLYYKSTNNITTLVYTQSIIDGVETYAWVDDKYKIVKFKNNHWMNVNQYRFLNKNNLDTTFQATDIIVDSLSFQPEGHSIDNISSISGKGIYLNRNGYFYAGSEESNIFFNPNYKKGNSVVGQLIINADQLSTREDLTIGNFKWDTDPMIYDNGVYVSGGDMSLVWIE